MPTTAAPEDSMLHIISYALAPFKKSENIEFSTYLYGIYREKKELNILRVQDPIIFHGKKNPNKDSVAIQDRVQSCKKTIQANTIAMQ